MSSQPNLAQAIVIDSGSSTIKAGLSGESRPSLVFPNYIATSKSKQSPIIGREINLNQSSYRLSYPISRGKIENWPEIEAIWQYIYTSLSTTPSPVVLSECPLTAQSSRERSSEFFFETLNSPKICFGNQSVLSLLSTSSTTGIVLDCGEGVTHAVPVFDGFALTHATSKFNLAGKDVTDHLALLLKRSGFSFNTSIELEHVKKIKEQNCFLRKFEETDHPELKITKSESKDYLLPDGRSVRPDSECFRASEILFNPEKIGFESKGIHECLVQAINRTEIDLRRNLFASIYLAGGTSLMKGFGERLMAEVRKISSKEVKYRINVPADRVFACWKGGAAVAALDGCRELWIEKREYEEIGKRALVGKGF